MPVEFQARELCRNKIFSIEIRLFNTLIYIHDGKIDRGVIKYAQLNDCIYIILSRYCSERLNSALLKWFWKHICRSSSAQSTVSELPPHTRHRRRLPGVAAHLNTPCVILCIDNWLEKGYYRVCNSLQRLRQCPARERLHRLPASSENIIANARLPYGVLQTSKPIECRGDLFTDDSRIVLLTDAIGGIPTETFAPLWVRQ